MAVRVLWLRLRVPPLAVAAAMALAIWASDRLFPELSIPVHDAARLLAAPGIALCGVMVSLSAVLEFRKAGTTVNPLAPESVSSFVIGGVYRWSRNPMYLGFLLILAGQAVFLGNVLGAMSPVLFVLYMNRFQIAPEEEVLAARYGAAYLAYRETVPRWI